jgi:hypothetical protein
MGQQQLLLIILGVIIVGIAIAIGLQLFQAGSIDANQDAMISDVMNIAAHADQWRIRPVTMGGGDGVFTNYEAPDRLRLTANVDATGYEVDAGTDVITISGVSALFGADASVELIYTPQAATEAGRYEWTFGPAFRQAN